MLKHLRSLSRQDPVTLMQGGLLLVAAVIAAAAGVSAVRPGVRAQGMEGPPPGQGPFGRGMMQQEQKIVAQFDRNKDDRLDSVERKAAREWLASSGSGGRRGFGGHGRGGMEPGAPGRSLKPSDVRTYGAEPLYDLKTVRTVFVQFEGDDWEQELAAFNNTDVEVPATVTVDGKVYKDVGVHFRGASSFMMIPEGSKRSLNLSFDFTHEDQALGGYRTLNLLNSNGDPTFVRGVLYSQIAQSYIPTPKTNYMRVAINGESWGIYLNAQQYNKDFLRDFFKTDRGARWKVPGSPAGRGGMEYLGEDPAAYKRLYEIKTKDNPKVWSDLIAMFKVLNETPPGRLEAALSPLLDIDGTLKFLAIEMALVNTDGYWTRASDYSIYQDEKGRFHVIPHDMNEALMNEGFGRGGPGRGPGGPPPNGADRAFGGRGGRGFGPRVGVDLDPLVGLDDATKPLRSKLLAVPELRARYLFYVRDIAVRWLDWQKLEPMLTEHQRLIAADVKGDTRKLYSFEAFGAGLAGSEDSLRDFVERRRAFLLKAIGPKTAAE